MSKSPAYPFVTRKQLVVRLGSEPAFVAECAAVLQARTEQRAVGGAPHRKPWGWMSSERVVAGRLTAKSRIGMLSEDEEAKLAKLVSRYSRQLADHFRALALAENPGLSMAAVKFGVLPTASDPTNISQGPRERKEMPSRCHSPGSCPADELEDNLDAEPEGAPEVIDAEPDMVDDGKVTDSGADSGPIQEDALAPRVMAFVERAPGQRTDAIAKALDTTTAMIAPTLRMLVQGRRLKKQGVGRGTRYFFR